MLSEPSKDTACLHDCLARRDAGETFSAIHRGDDTDERDTDDVTPEEMEDRETLVDHGQSSQGEEDRKRSD